MKSSWNHTLRSHSLDEAVCQNETVLYDLADEYLNILGLMGKVAGIITVSPPPATFLKTFN